MRHDLSVTIWLVFPKLIALSAVPTFSKHPHSHIDLFGQCLHEHVSLSPSLPETDWDDVMTSLAHVGSWAGEFAAMATTARCWKRTQ